MPTRTLVCGSLAYDIIMVFPDRFARHILPDQTHMLSVSFQVGEMRREWGGCAGNIAYNLQAIGGAPAILGTLGEDGDAYQARLQGLGMDVSGVRRIAGTYTAQAFIITDLDDNQITAFHPGAMNRSHEVRPADAGKAGLAIVGPDGKQGMREHLADLAGAGVPVLFDPGQGLPLFDGPELREMIGQSTYLAVNDYEGKLLAERTGWSLEAIAGRVRALVVTHGGEGSTIHAEGRRHAIPAVRPAALVDPTGCGDAYRAGLLYGIAEGWDWERTGRLAAVLGSLKIASRGGQNHAVNRDVVATLYSDAFGRSPW
jgi:adenosine kinase